MRKTRIIAGNKDFRSSITRCSGLVRPHCHRSICVLYREDSTEPAALLCVRQLDEVDVAHRGEKLQWAVTNPQHPQGMTSRVVSDAMRKGRTDVGDTEDVDEKFGQFIDGGRDLLDVGLQLHICRARRDVSMLVAHRADAGTRRRDHGVVPGEGSSEIADRRHSGVGIAGIGEHLPATGLLDRKIHLASELT